MPIETQTQQLPVQHRALQLVPDSWNAEERTIDVIWSTGARVARFDWSRWETVDEELSMEPGAVRLDRLNASAAVLDTHASWRLRDQIGVVVPGSARVEGGRGHAKVRFSRRAEVEPIIQDISDGIIRNISVGYRVHTYDVTEREGQRALYRAVDWEPNEISFVPVPADAGAQVRNDAGQGGHPCIIRRAVEAPAHLETDMEEEDNILPGGDATEGQAQTEQRNDPPAPATVTAARVLQAARNAGLSAEVQAELMDAHGQRGFTQDGLMAQIGRRFAERDEARGPGAGGNRVEVDESEKIRAAAGEALEHRVGLTRGAFQHGGELFRSLSLVEMGRELLARAGEPRARSMDRMAVAGAMLSRATIGTSDFPLIVANLTHKTLRRSYEAASRTFTGFVRIVEVPDFKTVSRVALGDAPELKKLSESGEITHGKVGETAEQYALATYGRMLSFTRRLIVNDDLSAFTRIPEMFGRRAAELEGDIVYGVLDRNAAMADGIALFHADHGNLAGTATGITEAGISAGRAAMRKQRGIDGGRINVAPRSLIVGEDKETEAQKFLSAILATKTGDVNIFSNSLDLVVDPRVPGNRWHLAADPAQIDTIELAYLEGRQGPVVEEQAEFDVDGIKIRVLFDVEAAAIDYRGFYRNNGAQ